MLQKQDALKSIFHQDSGFAKDIEFIRVDGASDKGPSHHEVQFLWTERHISRPTKVTLVTTRASGDSFLNRVELQNGCLGRGHSNLFIPSTLRGEPYDEEGQFSETKHQENLEAALVQYIERVDGTSCMGTNISLYRGASDHTYLERRNRLLRFLRGTEKERKELKEQHPRDHDYFEKVWKVRQNHLDHSLPCKYIFFLRCCKKGGCPHPLCKVIDLPEQNPPRVPRLSFKDLSTPIFCTCRKPESGFMINCDQCGEWYHGRCVGLTEAEGKIMVEGDVSYVCVQCLQRDRKGDVLKWHPNGPSFLFFPFPVIDPTRSWGSTCASCGAQCKGHYVTNIEKLLELHNNASAKRALPPSLLIEEAFSNGCTEKDDVAILAKKCCLSIEDVAMWISHLEKKKVIREQAAKKARRTKET